VVVNKLNYYIQEQHVKVKRMRTKATIPARSVAPLEIVGLRRQINLQTRPRRAIRRLIHWFAWTGTRPWDPCRGSTSFLNSSMAVHLVDSARHRPTPGPAAISPRRTHPCPHDES
jgi:hypothetical protein